jgi:DNA-binding HxlR family transcriptional regulator
MMLEENGLISKQDHPDSKAKVLYKLTEKGINLLPLMIEINLWAEKCSEIPESQKEILNEVKKDKEGFIGKQIDELKREVL